MTPKVKTPWAPLPRAEVWVYWVLSVGSHLYSFYQLHKFSKEHESRLQREFQLERGLVEGFKRDPLDFEWSFWTEWAKKSLLCTLIGHGVISRLMSVFCPKFRVQALTMYGLLAAGTVLGMRGVSVLLLHLGLSYSVALLRKPVASWACNLVLLSTLYIQPLQDVQRGWYQTEEEHYLLLFSVAVCALRFVSFSLDHCAGHGGAHRLGWLLSYTFYHPFFYNGPVIAYRDYVEQMRRPAEAASGGATPASALSYAALRSGRIAAWWCLAEYMIHVMYMHAIQSNETYLEILPPWALGGLALALVQFFYVKYLVLFGLPCMLATLDKIVPPQLPRCVSIMHSFTGMWRHFDEGLYRWLIRYIYVPLGGSRHGPLHKLLSTAAAFGFVCFWHGGHDYLQCWALMNCGGLLLERGLKSLLASPSLRSLVERNLSAAMERRCFALLSACSTAMLILSNLMFLGGTHVGRVFWKRVFVQGCSSVAPPMLAFLYCFAQIGIEWTSSPP